MRYTRIFVRSIITLMVGVTGMMTSLNALNVGGERLDTGGSLIEGTNVTYYIDPDCEYTAAIPSAIQRLMYPSKYSNKLVLTRTYSRAYSKVDFYQYSSNDLINASTVRRKLDSKGNYYSLTLASANNGTSWNYGYIDINDNYMAKYSQTKRNNVILHEILHVYGLRDLYSTNNRYSIMYGSSEYFENNREIDSFISTVLNSKYK